MNYLAHLSLSHRSTHALVGNLMGDFRKHIQATKLPEGVLQGIENHCRIDKFTDNHPEIRNLKNVFSNQRRRFAGIIMDVAFDHFLSCHWHEYYQEDRRIFIDYAYTCLRRGACLMPPRMQHAVHSMITEDWLGSYADLSGIAVSLNRMSQRIRFQNKLYGAVEEIQANYAVLDRGFLEFYPQLIAYINDLSGMCNADHQRMEASA